MKVLFLSSTSDDHLSATVWDGLAELLGEDNVYDASHCKSLHLGNGDNPCSRVGGSRNGKLLVTRTGTDAAIATPRLGGSRVGKFLGDDGDFDLMVVHSCFLRDHPHDWPKSLMERLKPGAKIAWLEGWDSAHEVCDPRCFLPKVDAVFRREIDPSFTYPYEPHCLMFAAPNRWFRTDDHERHIDIFYAGNHSANPARWDVLEKMWQTKTRHWSIGASRGLDFDRYFENLQNAKIGLCPAGAADGDGLRTWEVIAAGAIPIFVGYPNWKRDPWFGDEVFTCPHISTLPDFIDMALAMDLRRKRCDMQTLAKVCHTTLARAEKILRVLGI